MVQQSSSSRYFAGLREAAQAREGRRAAETAMQEPKASTNGSNCCSVLDLYH